MGHQIRVFLSNQDSLKLKKELQKVGPSVLVYSRSRGPFPKPFVADYVMDKEKPWPFFFLVREIDLELVRMKEVPTQSYWTIDQLRSPVIEFTDCMVDERTVKKGRLYYTSSYYDDEGKLIKKSADFQNWAKEIFRSTRKLLKYDKELEAYLGTDVIRQRDEGIELIHF